MSVKPEADSEGSWYGDDFEKIDRFRSTSAARRDVLGEERQMRDWEDEQSGGKQFSSHSESDRQPLPVAMETASTGNVILMYIVIYATLLKYLGA